MAANTDFKLTDLAGNELFNFTFSGENWTPMNINYYPQITGEEFNIPWDNISQVMDLGLGVRNIVLQGNIKDDVNRWKLTSAMADRRVKKLWLGEDWFFYVVGMEPRSILDQSVQGVGKFTAAFNAYDPAYYYANGSGDAGTATPKVDDNTWTGTATKDIITDLTNGTEPNSTFFVEPCFWVDVPAGTTITSVVIVDDTNRKLTLTETIAGAKTYIIFPYYNMQYSGFMVNSAVAYETTLQYNPQIQQDWAFDQPLYTDYKTASATLIPSTRKMCKLARNSTAGWRLNRYYPRAEDDMSTTFSTTVNYSAGSGNVIVGAQFLLRRM